MKFFLRFILLLGWILVGLVWLVIFNKFFSNNVYKKTLVNFGKVFIAICGAKVSLKNGQNIKDSINTVIVSNHISWLDIFAIHSIGIPGIFIAKSEIKAWPLIGTLIVKARTIFIDRASRHSILNVLEKSKNLLASGHTIIFFPEGTTSDGFKILPFHSSLFTLFLDNPQSKLLPIVIRYSKFGKKTSEAAYVDEMSLWSSIVKVLGSSGLQIEIEAFEVVNHNFKLTHTNKSRTKKKLAETIREKMLSKI